MSMANIGGAVGGMTEGMKNYGQMTNQNLQNELLQQGTIPHQLLQNQLLQQGTIPHQQLQNQLLQQGAIPHQLLQNDLIRQYLQQAQGGAGGLGGGWLSQVGLAAAQPGGQGAAPSAPGGQVVPPPSPAGIAAPSGPAGASFLPGGMQGYDPAAAYMLQQQGQGVGGGFTDPYNPYASWGIGR
jgi:hypothetical protein